MRRRLPRILLVLFLLLVLVCGGAFAWLVSPEPERPGTIPENVERIKPGMSSKEVEGLLGLRYPPEFRVSQARDVEGLSVPVDCVRVLLFSDECDVWVYLDADNRVISFDAVGEKCREPRWLLRLRRRLKTLPF